MVALQRRRLPPASAWIDAGLRAQPFQPAQGNRADVAQQAARAAPSERIQAFLDTGLRFLAQAGDFCQLAGLNRLGQFRQGGYPELLPEKGYPFGADPRDLKQLYQAGRNFLLQLHQKIQFPSGEQLMDFLGNRFSHAGNFFQPVLGIQIGRVFGQRRAGSRRRGGKLKSYRSLPL